MTLAEGLDEFYAAQTAAPETAVSSLVKPWARPLVSEALAVHPKQVEQANERNRKAGVNVTYNRKGQAVIPDRGERKKLLRLEGMIDRSSYTGY